MTAVDMSDNQNSQAAGITDHRKKCPGVLCKGLYFTCLCLIPFAAGGFVYLSFLETGAPPVPGYSAIRLWGSLVPVGICVLILTLTLSVSGYRLQQFSRRRMIFGTVWCLFLLCLTVATLELLLRRITPEWPAVGLHGVSEDIARTAWAHTEQSADGINSWGQRDRYRSVQKAPGMRRIAFIGDSFLEESTTETLSERVETLLGRPDTETINLGVSATDPDEYYYRLAKLAVDLDIDHCVMCLFSGNDFTAPARTLESYGGIAAVYPRGSAMTHIGLYSLNHILTNHRRPVLQAWFASGELQVTEDRLGRAIATGSDKQVRDLLYSIDHESRTSFQNETLAARLNDPEATAFFDVLRHPDRGLFRSYYLTAAIWSASVGGGQWNPLSHTAAWHWVRHARLVCRRHGIEFTLVIIPEAFQVDPRLIEQWMPLTNMTTLTGACRRAAAELKQRAEADQIAVIDLHDAFDGVSGTYLNLDGHWSDAGCCLAAETIVRRLQKDHDQSHSSSNGGKPISEQFTVGTDVEDAETL